jgi:hypothetical protein
MGGYGTGETFVDGMVPAVWVGAVLVAIGALVAFAIPTGRRTRRALQPATESA